MEGQKIENGFTPINNKLLEKIYSSDFTIRELKIILAVIRYTLGFNRAKAELSLRFLSEATGVKYYHLSETIKSLESKNVLLLFASNKYKQGRSIILNTDFQTWFSNNKSESNSSRLRNSSHVGNSSQISNGLVPEKGTVEFPNQEQRKENIKKTLKKGINSFPDIPEELKQVKGFDENWSDWISHRKEIKKPLTPLAIDKQFKKLIEFKNKGYDIIDIIDRSIRSSWQDFYEPKDFGINNKPKEKILDLDKW